MSPEENELLRRTLALAEENNQMLRGVQKHLRFNRVMSWAYWVFIIGASLGAFYLIQPYINSLTGAYDGSKSTFDSGINNIINGFKSSVGGGQ